MYGHRQQESVQADGIFAFGLQPLLNAFISFEREP
jgi:hypothetical protein